jgi:hypothetical protein
MAGLAFWDESRIADRRSAWRDAFASAEEYKKTPRLSMMPQIQITYKIRGVFVQMWAPFIVSTTRRPTGCIAANASGTILLP